MIRIVLVALALLLSASGAQAQGYTCRTSPTGASTSYCASEAFVTGSRGTLTPAAFSTLAACSGTTEGQTADVTDSTTDVFGATISGSGSFHVLAYCNGTNWTVAGTSNPTVGISPGVDTNTLRAVTSGPDTILTSDCGKTIQEGAGSSGFWAVTLPSISGFSGTCRVTVINGDTGRGKALSGFPTTMTSPNMLWPGQTVELRIVNGAWAAENPGRWKVPNNTITYMDVLNGSDSNDCLANYATDHSGPCKTFNQVLRINAKDYFDFTGISNYPTALLTVQLADNDSSTGACSTCYSLAHIAFTPVGNEGRATIVIKGDATTPGNTIVADTAGNNIGAFGAVNIELANLQIGQSSCASTPKANSGISANDGANIRIEGGVILGCMTAQQVFNGNHGTVALDGGLTITGGGTNFVQLNESGIFDAQGNTITCSGSIPYSQQTVTAQYNSSAVLGGVTWSGCGSVTGTRYFGSGLSIIDTGTGTPNSVIPGNANGSVATGAVAN